MQLPINAQTTNETPAEQIQGKHFKCESASKLLRSKQKTFKLRSWGIWKIILAEFLS